MTCRLTIVLWSIVLGAPFAAPASAAPPNILFITADDLGCQLSCYGETRFATPKLDALAAQGVRFERAYVAQSSCSSSRSTLLTGLWPHQNRQLGLAHLGFQMTSGLPNLPSLLKASGYRTGIIGKLHVEPAQDFPWDWMPTKEKMSALPTRNVRWVAQQSRAFFATAKQAGQPFFYYVNFFDPHGPYTPKENQVDGLPEKPLQAADIRAPYTLWMSDEALRKKVTATIANTILRVDAGVGLLLDELRAAGVADNTLVLFIGDNGLPGTHGKATSYEPGVHVPLLARWPGAARAGQVRRELVSAVDLMPTMLTAAGVKLPANLPGRPLQPLLSGAPADWREFLFTEMNFHLPINFVPQRTVRDERYKLLLNYAPAEGQAPVELFDLQADPGESQNLADDPARAATRTRLETALHTWQVETADPLLDTARLQRWKDATARWLKLPRVKMGVDNVVRIGPADLELLK